VTGPDFFDRTEMRLQAGMRRGANLPWPQRLRLRVLSLGRGPRALVAVAVTLVIAGPALAAAGLFSTGSSVPPVGHPVARTGNGVTVAGGAQLTALRVADPAGGLPWGLRLTRTTRGYVCLSVGRVLDDRLGALGEDHSFGDDGRFHPFSPDYATTNQCVTPDAKGHAFAANTWYGAAISAYSGPDGYCTVQWAFPPRLVAIFRKRRRPVPKPVGKPCPKADVRDIYYGLLGPDATEVAYRTPDGKLHIEHTAGPDGAYLIVLRHNPQNEPSTGGSGRIESGTVIVGVAWRTGHNCGVLGPQNKGKPYYGCATHGYVAPVVRVPSATAVRRPLTLKRLPGHLGQAEVSFTAPVATIGARSFYAIALTDPPHRDPGTPADASCGLAGTGGRTLSNIHAGQLVKFTTAPGLPCYGPARGVVALVIEKGPETLPPLLSVSHLSRQWIKRLDRIETTLIIGRFSYEVPRRK
jgi:hypothetical protein